MGMNSKKDDLEQFIQTQLSNYEPAENAWNVPPEDALDDALAQLEAKPKKKPRFGFIFFLLGLIILLGVVFQFSRYDQKISGLSEQLESTKASLNNVKNEIQELEKQDHLSPNNVAKKESISKSSRLPGTTEIPEEHLKDQSELATHTKNTPIEYKEIPPANQVLSNRPDPIKSVHEPLELHQRPISLPTDNTESNQLIQEQLVISGLASIPLRQLDHRVPVLPTEPLAFTRKKNNRYFHLDLSGSSVLLKQVGCQIPEHYNAMAQHSLNGKYFGIDLGWRISRKWQLESGLHHFSYQAVSIHERQFNFSTGTEHIPTLGPNDTDLELELHSPLGEMEVLFIFTRDPSAVIPDGALITLNIETQSRLNYLSIPLVLQYEFLSKDRLGMFIKGGVSGQILMNDRFELQEVTSPDSPLRLIDGETLAKPSGIERHIFNYLVGAGLDYRLSPRFSITLEPTYTRSLNPLVKNELVIHSATLGIFGGLRFRL